MNMNLVEQTNRNCFQEDQDVQNNNKKNKKEQLMMKRKQLERELPADKFRRQHINNLLNLKIKNKGTANMKVLRRNQRNKGQLYQRQDQLFQMFFQKYNFKSYFNNNNNCY
ncbi:unnamed protein product [Paramecium sonneborni]|uniref:Uncharacterized protein n=1 Tax=Paramecium sonneborni TaxID=65129 RepID=A0A8S1RQE0_9CILI|nr:unnamed protein product [Paramecium sonneborni]